MKVFATTLSVFLWDDPDSGSVIQGHSDHKALKEQRNPLLHVGKDSPVPLMYGDLSDLGSLILIIPKEHTLCL